MRELERPRVPVGLILFESASEFACAALLEKYTEWRAHPGATLQIQVGRCFFDFRVGNTFVEYHPISLRREFLTNALSDILSAARYLNKDKRSHLLESVAGELRAQYQKRRGQVLSAHPNYAQCDLVCVSSPEEFINLVLRRFAPNAIGSTKDISAEFRKLCRSAKR